MPKYFKLAEFTYSLTAYKLKIDNTPNDDERAHIEELMDFMDGFRAFWGGPLLVKSGFRSEKLNEKVGGVKTSGHRTGYAVDFVPANNKKLECFEAFKEYLKDREFDELLLERNSKGSTWIHFALKSIQGKQRKKIKVLEVK